MYRVRRVSILAVFLFAFAFGSRVLRAEPAGELATRAEAAYQAGNWNDAEPLFEKAASSTENLDRKRHCYRRLVEIAFRSASYDKVIRLENSYLPLLDRQQDRRHRGELLLRVAESHFALGHYRAADTRIDQGLALHRQTSLPPAIYLSTLVLGVRIADKYQNEVRLGELWQELQKAQRAFLAETSPLPANERIDAARKLATAYEQRRLYGDAIELLRPLPAMQDMMDDPGGKAQTLEQMARNHASLEDHKEAVALLRQAIAIHNDRPDQDLRRLADLQTGLAESLEAIGDSAEARKLFQAAAESYQAVLDQESAGGDEVIGKIDAFWKLQSLWQRTRDLRRAVELAESRSEEWVGHGWMEPRIQAELGGLQVALGEWNKAKEPLQNGLQALREQSPVNLVALTSGLNSLALLALSNGDLSDAESLVQECLDLYRKYELPVDLIQSECYSLAGSIRAARGEYALAVDQFREGIDLASRLENRLAEPQRCRLLLNLAQVHRSQGELVQAVKVCKEAWDAFRPMAPNDTYGHAAFACALAGMEGAQGNFRESRRLANLSLKRQGELGITSGPLWTTAKHCLALEALAARRTAEAKELWQTILVQLPEPAKPRTLNYLAIAAETEKNWSEAASLLSQARQIQATHPQGPPVTGFITLWRLAVLKDRAGARDEAVGLLEEALALVEAARMRTYGAAEERARYFAQFQPAFDQLVTWYVEARDIDKAFITLERGRSRAFLDQFQLAGADPRRTLAGVRGEELRKKESELRARLASQRARAQHSADITDAEATELASAMEQTQTELSEVWKEILAASPMYRNLATNDLARSSLSALRQSTLVGSSKLLAYHLGRDRSYLFLLGGNPDEGKAFELKIPRWVVASLAQETQQTAALELAGTRGLVLQPRNDMKSPLAAPSSTDGTVPLTRELSRHLVDHWRGRIEASAGGATRGLELTDKTGASMSSDDASGLDPITEVLLPAAVRKDIESRVSELLVVVPDGPLHKLPLEALVVRHATRPVFAIEELPPIVYAPSAAALAALVERSPKESGASAAVLTVGNPAYPQEAIAVANVEGTTVASRGLGNHRSASSVDRKVAKARAMLEMHSSLPPLPYTATECQRIEQLFAPRGVLRLAGTEASEQKVTQAIAGKRIVHLAAHGFADDRFGNMFGALALTPPATQDEMPTTDGFLSLYEIAELPLDRCELAVLSACVTNVGPQRPLEAGVTLASGFLMAGAHRVVASHWHVDDRSTAELMATFLDRVERSDSSGDPVNYAKALKEARLKIRNTPEWSSPRHWASFVLLGPAQDRLTGN